MITLFKKKKRLKKLKRNLMMNSVRDIPRIEYLYKYANIADCIVLKYNRTSSEIVSKLANIKLRDLLGRKTVKYTPEEYEI